MQSRGCFSHRFLSVQAAFNQQPSKIEDEDELELEDDNRNFNSNNQVQISELMPQIAQLNSSHVRLF
jgi:hypothetical protein